MAQPIQPRKMGRPVKITEDVIMFAEIALAHRFHKGEVKALLQTKKQMSARSAETVISKARARLATRTGKSPDELRNESYLFYDAVVRSADASPREKLLAQERIDRLFALEGPIKIDTGRAGPADTELVLKLLRSEKGRELLEEMDDLVSATQEGA